MGNMMKNADMFSKFAATVIIFDLLVSDARTEVRQLQGAAHRRHQEGKLSRSSTSSLSVHNPVEFSVSAQPVLPKHIIVFCYFETIFQP